MSHRGAQELAELLVGPGAAFELRERSLSGSARNIRDIATEQTSSHRVGERTSNDQVDLIDRLRGERSLVRGGGEKLLVQRFDLVVS